MVQSISFCRGDIITAFIFMNSNKVLLREKITESVKDRLKKYNIEAKVCLSNPIDKCCSYNSFFLAETRLYLYVCSWGDWP